MATSIRPVGEFFPPPIRPIDFGSTPRNEESPLVGIRLEIVVDEDGVPFVPWFLLKREGDEISESACRHRVLVGEEAVVRRHPKLVAPRHRFRKQVAAHLPGDRGGNRTGKEEPGMGALSRPGPLNCWRDPDPAASRDERRHVLLPRWSVEIGRQEPTGLIGQKRVDSDYVPALEMVEDDLVGDREEGPVGTPAALHAGFLANSAHPFVGTNGGVAFPAGLGFFPQSREDVLPAPEEVPEKGDLLSVCGRGLGREG